MYCILYIVLNDVVRHLRLSLLGAQGLGTRKYDYAAQVRTGPHAEMETRRHENSPGVYSHTCMYLLLLLGHLTIRAPCYSYALLSGHLTVRASRNTRPGVRPRRTGLRVRTRIAELSRTDLAQTSGKWVLASRPLASRPLTSPRFTLRASYSTLRASRCTLHASYFILHASRLLRASYSVLLRGAGVLRASSCPRSR